MQIYHNNFVFHSTKKSINESCTLKIGSLRQVVQYCDILLLLLLSLLHTFCAWFPFLNSVAIYLLVVYENCSFGGPYYSFHQKIVWVVDMSYYNPFLFLSSSPRVRLQINFHYYLQAIFIFICFKRLNSHVMFLGIAVYRAHTFL